MNDLLICELTTFSLMATLHLPDGTEEKVPVSDLGKLLPSFCNIYEINKVKVFGDNKEFIYGILDEAKFQETTQFGVNNIVYEII